MNAPPPNPEDYNEGNAIYVLPGAPGWQSHCAFQLKGIKVGSVLLKSRPMKRNAESQPHSDQNRSET